ncbi:hypothetical protein [Nocardia jinanensis]|uniref:Uncharacterized protein n=1 Tax=Nocardia jinanensis TaxID=382504 RepID=A0A917RV70_9NOCA|nr:hypothetical protein [Nocardia jinanensis]GGL32091.1 hypothetical protein GCM10011588_53650 [Nocardia jinanensis]
MPSGGAGDQQPVVAGGSGKGLAGRSAGWLFAGPAGPGAAGPAPGDLAAERLDRQGDGSALRG